MITSNQKEILMTAARTGRVNRAGKFIARELTRHGMTIRPGQSVTLSPQVKAGLRSDLVHLYGVPEDQLSVSRAASDDDGSRGAGLARYGDDKSGRGPVFNDRIMIRSQPGRALTIGGANLVMPDGVTMTVDRKILATLSAPGVILVENEECFYRFERLNFEVPLCWRDHVVVFRGKPQVARQDTCEAWLKESGLPVVAFPDFDPAGLVLAAAAPGVVNLLWPGRAELAKLLETRGRADLRAAQAAYIDRSLSLPGVFGEVARMIQEAGRALNEEAFLRR